MSKRHAKKKDFLPPPEPSTEPPITPPYEPKKIKPLTCLRSLRYTASSEKDYRDLNVKRKYSRKLYLAGNPCSSTNNKTFLKTYKKMKFVQELEIKDFSSFYTCFFKKMSQFRKVTVNLDLKYRLFRSDFKTQYQARFDLLRHGSKLRRLNLTSFRIKMINDGFGKFKDLSDQFASLLKGMIYMGNLKEFSIDVEKAGHQYRREIKGYGPFIPKEISCRMKRLKCIERLRLALHDFPKEVLKNFTESLGCFSSLKSVDFATLDQTHDRQLLQQISTFQSLTSVTLREFIQPNEIILLASKVPSLRTIAIKGDWIFTQFGMPSLDSMKSQTVNIQQLHIHVPLNIDYERDVNFVVNFIDAFPQLRSLDLNLAAKNHKNTLDPIGKAINRLQMLEEIKLSILVRIPGVQNSLLSCLDNLKELRKTTLILTKTISQGWDKDIQETHQALRTLLLANKNLQDIKIRWEGLTQKCFEHLSLILNEMKELNRFELEFIPAQKDHTASHKDILKSMEECFSNTNTKIKNATIRGTCGSVRGKNCDEMVLNLNEVIKSNANFENFAVHVKPYNWSPNSN